MADRVPVVGMHRAARRRRVERQRERDRLAEDVVALLHVEDDGDLPDDEPRDRRRRFDAEARVACLQVGVGDGPFVA